MDQNPSWEPNRSSDSQEIPCILWNLKVHCRTLKHSQSAPILSQINPVHAFSFHFFKIHFNIILSSTPRSFKWPLSLIFPLKPCMHLSCLLYVPCAPPIEKSLHKNYLFLLNLCTSYDLQFLKTSKAVHRTNSKSVWSPIYITKILQKNNMNLIFI